MKQVLNELIDHRSLTKEKAREVLIELASGKHNPSQMASFMTVYMMRTITVDELTGFRDAMLELCVPVDLEVPVIDVCGTGGDGKNTFNISTLASFVVAGAGQAVAKHGNYGVSSPCGSSNVLEYFGCKFTNDIDQLRQSVDNSGICFMHAPLFHPAMKNVGPIRKELGVKTFFNMLGPMVNPAIPVHQMVGVFNLELARQYGYLYQQTNKNYVILHSLDGYDEISLTGSMKYYYNGGERIIGPEDLNLPGCQEEDLFGGTTIEDSAGIFKNVIEGRGTLAQNAAVIANAGMALYCANQERGLSEAIDRARESLESGAALSCFKKFLNN